MNEIPIQEEILAKKKYNEAYRKGKDDGAHATRTKMTIRLANLYYGNGYPHSWFPPINWFRRDSRLKAYIDNLWEQYGPVEYEDEDPK